MIDHPETLAVFQELGIDTCCGGKSLGFAGQQRGLDGEAVLAQLLRHLDAGRETCTIRLRRHVLSGDKSDGD